MNPLHKWAIVCYEFLFAEPGTAWEEIAQQVEINWTRRQQVVQLRSRQAAVTAADRPERRKIHPAQYPAYHLPDPHYSAAAKGAVFYEVDEDDLDDGAWDEWVEFAEFEDDFDLEAEADDDLDGDLLEELEDESGGWVEYHLEELAGDLFVEFNYAGDRTGNLDEAAIVQVLTHLWHTTPYRPNNQLSGRLQLPIGY